jgi:hypothetical protein
MYLSSRILGNHNLQAPVLGKCAIKRCFSNIDKDIWDKFAANFCLFDYSDCRRENNFSLWHVCLLTGVLKEIHPVGDKIMCAFFLSNSYAKQPLEIRKVTLSFILLVFISLS